MKKRILSLLLGAGLAVSLLGCGAAQNSGSTASSQTQSAASTQSSSSADTTAAASTEGETAAESGTPVRGGTFTYARAASTTSFDLHQEITMNNAFAIDKVFEPLITFNNDGSLSDWLTSSHTISDDGLTYTFVLKDGITFSDGTPLTSADVKFSLQRHLDVGGSLPIDADVKSIDTPDDKTVVITLGAPYAPFLAELANFSNGIIPNNYGGKTEDEFFQNPIGTGPFVVSDWDPSGDLTFTRNENYWQEGKPYLDKLVYKVIDDDNQKVNQLSAGDIDGVEDLALSSAQTVDAGADTQIVTAPSWNTEELFFNTLDEHFADQHVRRALAYSLDREAITKALTFGYGTTAWTILPTSIQYNDNDTIQALKYDLDAAKKEMSESAYPDGFDTSISFAAGNNSRNQVAQIFQTAAAQLGINVKVDSKETATFRQDFMNYNYSIMINSATSDYPDANSMLDFQVNPDGFSKCYWTNYNNPDAVALLKKTQTTTDETQRGEAIDQLQQILADDVPYIPLYFPDVVAGIRSNVAGFDVRPNGSVHFEDVYFTN